MKTKTLLALTCFQLWACIWRWLWRMDRHLVVHRPPSQTLRLHWGTIDACPLAARSRRACQGTSTAHVNRIWVSNKASTLVSRHLHVSICICPMLREQFTHTHQMSHHLTKQRLSLILPLIVCYVCLKASSLGAIFHNTVFLLLWFLHSHTRCIVFLLLWFLHSHTRCIS